MPVPTKMYKTKKATTYAVAYINYIEVVILLFERSKHHLID